jgi:hypothetical protein
VSIQDWLDARRPAPPELLRRRIDELVRESGGVDDRPAATCLRAAERALERLVRQGDAGRAMALDLLAIDALVTYAFEAAADEPDSIADRAAAAMASLSRVSR